MEELITKASKIYNIIFVVAVNFMLIPNITFAQNNGNENETESAFNTPNRNETSIFSLYFREEGGLLPVSNYILFDDISNDLVYVNLVTDTISQKMLQNSETKILRDAILIARFFDLKPVYEGEGADIRKYLLTITDGEKSKTVSWNDASQVPEELNDLIKEIKKLSS